MIHVAEIGIRPPVADPHHAKFAQIAAVVPTASPVALVVLANKRLLMALRIAAPADARSL